MRYLDRIDQAARSTPDDRNRVVDTWRVIALGFVVFGHWISASIWVTDDGTVRALNTLEWIPGGDYLTWIFQVMPIFFIVGGFANAVSLSKTDLDTERWLVGRTRRLYTPVVPLVFVWVALVLAFRPFVTDDVLHAGTLSATIPLWFVAVYLAVIALSPITYRWWQSVGPWSALWLGIAAIATDILRFTLDVEAVGWINYVFVWAFLHQLGYWWHERHTAASTFPIGVGFGMIAGGMTALVVATSLDWYPIAMVTIPGGGTTNMIPPTFANGFLGIAQAGLIIVSMSIIRAVSHRWRIWRFVVGVSASMITIYLWHLTALSLVGAAGIFIADGWLFSFDPGSRAWWLMRVPFFIILVAATVGLVALFDRFEHRITRAPVESRLLFGIGLVVSVTAVSLMAFIGIVTKDAQVNWYIPIVAAAGATLTGSWPARKDPKST